MEVLEGFLGYFCKLIVFIHVFMLLLVIGIAKAFLVGPIVFLVIIFGNWSVVIGLWPMHVIWTYYCIVKTKKFGIVLKGLLFLTLPIPLLLWPVVGLIGSLLTGLGYGFFWPLMATFEAMGEGVSNKLLKCFTDGTWSSVLGGCTIVRDFADVSFHSYFSVMDGLLESKSDGPTEIKLSQIPGCTLAAILGVLIDVPIITALVIYKAPIMLFKGWRRLRELVQASFLDFMLLVLHIRRTLQREDCFILLLFCPRLMSTLTIFYTSQKVPAFQARPSYRAGVDSSSLLMSVKQQEQPEVIQAKQRPIRTPSMKMQALKAVVIWDNFFKGCEYTGKRLLDAGAIGVQDLEAWKYSKNNIINIGVPACTFLECFFRSIKSGSTGFLMRDNVELTNVNRPEERVFDWLFEPMSVMKEQIKTLNLLETEELYLYRFSLYCGITEKVEGWQNGGVPPNNEIRRAQIEGISRRLQGFCLTLSRLPTFRRRFHEVVKALVQKAKQGKDVIGDDIV